MRSRLSLLASRPLTLWALLWIGVCILYLPAWKGGFQQDFEGWMYYFHHRTFSQLINRTDAGIHSFYQVTQLQLYLITRLFDARPLLWFLLFTALHAQNGCLLFRFTNAVLGDFGIKRTTTIALAGTIFALFNPAMTEAVVWKASYHYLIGVQAVFWMLLWGRQYLLTGRRRMLWYSFLLFLPLTFTLEIWYVIPPLIFLLAVVYRKAGIISRAPFRATLLRLVLPLLGLLAVHLLLYRLSYGVWLPHSAYTSPGDDSVLVVAGRIWSYEAHLLGSARFLPNGIRHFLYTEIGGKTGGAVALGLIACATLLAYLRFPVWSAQKRVAALFAGCSLLSLAIVLHFPPPDLMLVSNDRYLYFTAFFQWPLAAMGIGFLLTRMPRTRAVVWCAMLALLVSATAVLVIQWRHATKVFWALQDKFRWQDAPVVLVLNLPATYNGIGIIQTHTPSELPDHMEIYHRNPPHGKVYDVAGYNMQHPWDGANVLVDDSLHLTVTLNQWGSWWWQGGFGATNYENELYAVDFTEPGHVYKLSLKRCPAGMVILLQQGQEWRVVDMARIGVPQW